MRGRDVKEGMSEGAINSDYKYIYKKIIQKYPDVVGNWDLIKSFVDDEISNIEITNTQDILSKFEEYRRKKFKGVISKMIGRDVKEGMSEEEWANSKEQDRLEKLPIDQQQKIKKIIAMMKAEKETKYLKENIGLKKGDTVEYEGNKYKIGSFDTEANLVYLNTIDNKPAEDSKGSYLKVHATKVKKTK